MGDAVFLAMLPPAKACAQDLLDHGFAAAVREHGMSVDISAIDALADDYLDADIGARLEAEIFGKGRARVWLMGISLGGWGCLSVARRRAAGVEGVILLAPFLGSREPKPLEAGLPPIYLGFGEADRYAGPSRTLAHSLPADRVVTLPGGHDWATWMRLWRALLPKTLLAVQA
jgi:pimeloyl-ACP methyl ester carboxylesterase